MPSRRCIPMIIAGLACCGFLSGAKGDETSSAPPSQVSQLIQQLGDESYDVREHATRQLSALGLTAKPELLAGMRNTDPEIRWRCRALWGAVRDADFQLRAEAFLRDPDGIDNYEFPGWDRYRRVFGVSPNARQTFLSLQKEEPMLWEESANAANDSPLRFLERCRKLRSALRDERKPARISGATALTLLFLSTQYEALISSDDRQLLKCLWEQPEVADIVKSDASWSEFRFVWLRQAGDDRPAFERLMEGLSRGEENVVSLARALLRNEETPANQKQFALLALAKHRFPEDDLLIQSFLDDATTIDTYFVRGNVIELQLRDIALATLIIRADKAPSDFGFAYLKPDDRTLVAPSSLGFIDDDARRAAYETWQVGEDLGRSRIKGSDPGV